MKNKRKKNLAKFYSKFVEKNPRNITNSNSINLIFSNNINNSNSNIKHV